MEHLCGVRQKKKEVVKMWEILIEEQIIFQRWKTANNYYTFKGI